MSKVAESTIESWRDRLIETRKMRAGDVLPHPHNPKLHPPAQTEPLKGLLREVGKVDFLRAYYSERNGNQLTYWDGHAREGLNLDELWNVAIYDITDAEADLLVATFDPLAALAEINKSELDALLQDVSTGDAAVMELLSKLAEDSGIIPTETNASGSARWDRNLEEDFSSDDGDGIEAAAGYRLASIWYGMSKVNECRDYMLDLPTRPDVSKGNIGQIKYSRTNVEETERIVKTYMRPGDLFYEMCCGWMTFSSTAKYFGLSGRGGDIWDTSLDFCKRQIAAMPGDGAVDVVRADCRDTKEPDCYYDFIHSNPPFFDLEPYGDSESDLASCKSYDRWLDAMSDMGCEAARILKPGGLANFVINDFRKDGVLIPMHAGFISAIGRESGLLLHDLVVAEVISQALKFRKHDYERRRTVKCHEYVITFKKPN